MINGPDGNRAPKLTNPVPIEAESTKTLKTSGETGQTSNNRSVTVQESDPKLSVKPSQTKVIKTPSRWKSIVNRQISRIPFSGLVNRIKNLAIKHGWIKPSFQPDKVAANDLAARLEGHLGKAPEVTETKNMQGLQITEMDSEILKTFLYRDGQDDSEVVVSNVDFAGADFTGVNLSGIRFENCRFDHAKLDKCQVYQSVFSNCSFSHTTMAKASISGSIFENCNLDYAKMADVVLSESVFTNCKTNNKTDLQSAAIDQCDLTGLPLDKVNMAKVFMVKGKVKTLPLNEKWLNCHLVAVEHQRALPPTGTWGVRGMTFDDMKLHFRGKPATSYTSPSYIPTARFTDCHFINSEVTMENNKYICNSCSFKGCPKVVLDIHPEYSSLTNNVFDACPDISSTTVKKHTNMRGNRFNDCTVDSVLEKSLEHGARGNGVK